jgi:hypothetical protein
MAQALRAVAQRPDISDGETREVLAFLALSLSELDESVEETAAAWERREFWLKADRFRLEWAPIQAVHGRLDVALRAGDMGLARDFGTDLARLLAERRLRPLKSSSTPWKGAWDAWLQKG